MVLSESTVVFVRVHAFQFQWCYTVTDKAAAVVLAPDGVHVSEKHIMVRLTVELDWRASNTCIVRECSVLLRVGNLVTDVYLPKKVLVYLTEQSLVFSGSFGETNRNSCSSRYRWSRAK